MLHSSHRMMDSSLLQYMEEHKNINFDEKFRNKLHKEIIQLLQLKPQGMTDREMANHYNYLDPNVVRPRRYELVYGTKRHPELAGILENAGERKCSITNRQTIFWTLNKNKLYAFMGV